MQPKVSHQVFENTQVSWGCLGYVCAAVQANDMALVLRLASYGEKVKAIDIVILANEELAKLVCIDSPATS
jgi:hypothetical protein